MINMRYGLFETNSSSTHTLTLIMDKSMFLEWQNNPEESFLKVLNTHADVLVPDDFQLVSRDYILENSNIDTYKNEDDEFYYLANDLDCILFDEECLKIINYLDNYVIVKYESY